MYTEPVPAGCYITLALGDEKVLARGLPYPGIPAVGTRIIHVIDGKSEICWEVLAVQVLLPQGGSRAQREGNPLTADVIVKAAEGVYVLYPGDGTGMMPDGGQGAA